MSHRDGVVACLVAAAVLIALSLLVWWTEPAHAVTLRRRLVVPRERLGLRPAAAWAESLRVCRPGSPGHPLLGAVTVRYGMPGVLPWRNERHAPGDTLEVAGVVRAPVYGRTDVYWLTAWAIPDTGAISCSFVRSVAVRWDSVATWR